MKLITLCLCVCLSLLNATANADAKDVAPSSPSLGPTPTLSEPKCNPSLPVDDASAPKDIKSKDVGTPPANKT